MRLHYNSVLLFTLLISVNCQSRKSETIQSDEPGAEKIEEIKEDIDNEEYYADENESLDYQELYGHYIHESNTTGFNGNLEILPEGNDLYFSLTVKKQDCTSQASGVIGIAMGSATEFAGFYDNADCRMEFIFNRAGKTIRIREIGICTIYEGRCSFTGTYNKKNNQF